MCVKPFSTLSRLQELMSEDIPKPSKDGVTIAVISGEALGVAG